MKYFTGFTCTEWSSRLSSRVPTKKPRQALRHESRVQAGNREAPRMGPVGRMGLSGGALRRHWRLSRLEAAQPDGGSESGARISPGANPPGSKRAVNPTGDRWDHARQPKTRPIAFGERMDRATEQPYSGSSRVCRAGGSTGAGRSTASLDRVGIPLARATVA